jgi:pilus assembly protein CpaB
MNRRILIIVTCALVLSACASYLVYRAVDSRVNTTKAIPTGQVVVATRDLVAGTVIQAADMKTGDWVGALPKGALSSGAGFLNRGVISPIYAGEPIMETRLAAKGSGGGLAGTIPPGMRACAVRVNEVVGVAGFVIPGMRVDVLITGQAPGGDSLAGASVRTLLQNIEVLSAGTDFQKDKEGKPQQVQVVNLLVTPAQAQILSLAGNETRIQLVLRNPMDTQIVKVPGIDMANLYGAAAPAKVQAPGWSAPPVEKSAPPPLPAVPFVPPYTIQVLNGAVHSQATFARPVEKK